MRSLLGARKEIARALVEPIRVGVARKDTGHAAFHGCMDWHSAVHGVWALTAYARSEDRTRALAAGFQIHLAKPIEPSELVTTIASLANRFPANPPDQATS